MKALNLGCGSRFHCSWTNVNFVSTGNGVIPHDLTQNIPFPDNTFDVVYHSHLLEHFPRKLSCFFLSECYRVLKPDGIIRVVVPDLERIVRTYLITLDQAESGLPEWIFDHEWIMLEMYDQAVRNQSGGDMIGYLIQEHIPNKEFVLNRFGIEAKKLIESRYELKTEAHNQPLTGNKAKQMLKHIYRFIHYPNYRREALIKYVLGYEYSTLEVGRFRQCGEVHQWMYDRYSLRKLLEQCGFKRVVQCTATDSYIPEWTTFNLDTEPDGTVYKPDSLFMEAIKAEL